MVVVVGGLCRVELCEGGKWGRPDRGPKLVTWQLPGDQGLSLEPAHSREGVAGDGLTLFIDVGQH